MTLTEIWENLDGSAPLYAVDPDSGDVRNTVTGTWLLTETLYVEDGITLQVTHIFMICIFYYFFACDGSGVSNHVFNVPARVSERNNASAWPRIKRLTELHIGMMRSAW